MPLKIRACPIKETVKNKIQKIQREQKSFHNGTKPHTSISRNTF